MRGFTLGLGRLLIRCATLKRSWLKFEAHSGFTGFSQSNAEGELLRWAPLYRRWTIGIFTVLWEVQGEDARAEHFRGCRLR